MIVVMQPEATQEQIRSVISLIHEMELTEHVIEGTELTVVAVLGDDRKKDPEVFETLAGVQKVLRVLAPYKMSARAEPRARTVVRLSDRCAFGTAQFPIIAGPCSVETEEQILQSARMVRDAGCHALRGGAFKPRTNPFSFQGHGEDGLKMLAAAREATGLPIVTEVMTPADVDLVAKYADCLQVGTRNAQNYRLLDAVGRQPRPVLYKRGMWATIDETLQAVDYILAAGNPNVILCERGIRTFERFCRNTYPLAAITEMRHRSHLPVIGDPSHGTGHAHLVPAMCRATLAAGGDGLAIEVHPDPSHAWSDGAQSLDAAQLNKVMAMLARIAPAVERTLDATDAPAPDLDA